MFNEVLNVDVKLFNAKYGQEVKEPKKLENIENYFSNMRRIVIWSLEGKVDKTIIPQLSENHDISTKNTFVSKDSTRDSVAVFTALFLFDTNRTLTHIRIRLSPLQAVSLRYNSLGRSPR